MPSIAVTAVSFPRTIRKTAKIKAGALYCNGGNQHLRPGPTTKLAMK